MKIGGQRWIMGPFGYIIEQPVCPHCGRDVSVWAVQSRQHTENCPQNPAFKERLEELANHFQPKETPNDN